MFAVQRVMEFDIKSVVRDIVQLVDFPPGVFVCENSWIFFTRFLKVARSYSF